MLLKRVLKLSNQIKMPLTFYINSFEYQEKILTLTSRVFCTAAVENTRNTNPATYYRDYMMSKPDKYPCFFNAVSLLNEAEIAPNPSNLLVDLLNNVEESLICNEKIKDLVTELNNSDVDELCKNIVFINKTIEKSKNKNNHKLIGILNKELMKKELLDNDILKVLIVHRFTKSLNFIHFLKSKSLKMMKKIDRLSPQQTVQFFYGIPILNYSQFEHKFTVYSYINNNISQFNADELGIILSSLAKCNLIFSHKNIINSIFSKIMDDIESIHLVSLGNISRALQKMSRKLDSSLVTNLQEKVIPFALNFNIPDLLNLLDLGIKSMCVNYSFWDIAAKKLKENMSTLTPNFLLRVGKQIELYKIEDEELLMQTITEFDKYKNYPKAYGALVSFLCSLSYRKLYPKDLLDIVLSEQFILERIIGNSSKQYFRMKIDWWILYCNLEIENPKNLSYRLNLKDRLKIYHLNHHLSCSLKSFKLNYNIYSSMKWIKRSLINLYGENTVVKANCLPQFESSLVLKFDKYLKAQPILQNFNLDNKSFVIKPLDDNYWITLNVLNENEYSEDAGIVSWYHQCQYRQLKTLGFIVINVSQEFCRKHMKEKTENIISELIERTLKKEMSLQF